MPDALDRKILRILMTDAHTPFHEIASQAGTTVGTVQNRIKKLRDEGIIKRFLPEVDAGKLDFGITTLI